MSEQSEQVQTVRVRLDDGRAVAVSRATPAEAWAAAVDAHLRGLDVAGAWQGVRTAEGAVLVPASLVVDGLRAVHSARLAAASRGTL